MRAKNLASYLDTGSMTLFAQQIVDTLGNVIAVSVHDPAGQLVWSAPDSAAGNHWSVSPFLAKRQPGPGYCERLSNKNFAYIFYLTGEKSADPIATLSIQVEPTDSSSYELAYETIRPILTCIERQLTINAELSSVRRMTAEGQKDLQLLVDMDQLDGSAGPHEILRSVLALTAEHFDVELSAVVIPNLGIQEVWPARLLEDESTSKAVMTTLGGLIAAAKMHHKVLLSDANITTRIVAGFVNPDAKVLSSPIINRKDEVIGIFVLMGATQYSKEQVRLARAVCSKIHTLTRVADQLSSEHYSRHGLLQYVANILRRYPDQSHALLYVDIDKLHVVNDTYGHLAGDEVIRRVGRIIDELASKDDAVSHLSGDKFGLFIRDCGEAKAVEKANLLLDTLHRETVEFENAEIEISSSVGIAMIPDCASDESSALNTAEIAARSAKDHGGNRSVVFRDLDVSLIQRRSDLDQVNHLQYALMQNRFVLYGQPIVSIQDNVSRLRYEILIRMLGDDGEVLPPSKFISAAERYQMMSAIDRWVINNTLEQLGQSDKTLEVNMASFSINVSAQSLAEDEFFEYIAMRISESGISPDALCFEITETAVVRNLERAQRFIRRLRKLGCRLALDDFGTGYCSFAYLKDLPVNYIKIDGVFVRDVLENPLSEAIIASMKAIANAMNAQTVAEHVENDLIIQRMRHHEIDFVQGFAVGRPVPLADILQNMDAPVMLDESIQLNGEKIGLQGQESHAPSRKAK
jgi:diguanylate cyclase (GGDEF)-like protein